MRNVFIAVILLSGFTLASCKKDYTCECAVVQTDENGNRNTSSGGNYSFNDSRIRAEKKCNDLEETGTNVLGNYTRECEIR